MCQTGTKGAPQNDNFYIFVLCGFSSSGNGHPEIRKMKIKEANLFNTVGCCI
jgi:hypothetical protein